ncbi:MAG: hypothetical protein ACOC3V_01655 [bacterium]
MAKYIEPFNFQEILINYFLGSGELFSFAFIILFSYGCAKYQMSNKVFLTLLVISSSLMAFWLGEVIYFILLFLTGLIISKLIANTVR